MPPRSISLAIVAFWLASMGWLLYRDVWPELRPGDRPPFTVDLAREAQGASSGTRWTIHRNGVRVGYAHTATVYHPATQTYEVSTRITLDKDATNEKERLKYGVRGMDIEVTKMASTYRLSPSGELLAVEAKVALDLAAKGRPALGGEVEVRGEVAGGVFRPRWRVEAVPFGSYHFDSEPVELRAHDTMLNPLQPWNRLSNVRPGQRWRMALFDPLGDSLTSMVPGRRPGVRYLEAGVMGQPDELFWDGKATDCFVIEYRGDGLTARTWVRRDNGLVLRQEAVKNEDTPEQDRLALERDPRSLEQEPR